MAAMKEIRNRIKSVTNTGQITKAMKMVAASNLRRVQAAMGPLQVFAGCSEGMLFGLLSAEEQIENCYVQQNHAEEKALYVMVVGNRGLCGLYNLALVQYAERLLKKDERNKELIVVGRWGRDVIKHFGLQVTEYYDAVSDIPSASESFLLAEKLKQEYRECRVSEVHLIYQTYQSAMKQEPEDKRLFPLQIEKTKEEKLSKEEFFFEPDKKQVADRLIEQYIENRVFAVLLEAKCGEHMARMTAMTNANENIDELIAKLQISYNRARQEAITNEISEIVGGANALRNKKGKTNE